MEKTLDVTILLSSLKKVIESNDKIRSDILKNTLTKIAFKNENISFDDLNEIKRDLEDIFKTAESFVASLRLINDEENEEEEIILEAPEEFRNGSEPKRSETYREEGNNDQRQPEVASLYTQEEVPCENQIQNTCTNDNTTPKELEKSKDKDKKIVSKQTNFNETNQNDNENDKITYTSTGSVVGVGCSLDKVGVVAKPDCYRLNELLLRPSTIRQYVLSGSGSTNVVSVTEANEDVTGVANSTRRNSECNNSCGKEVCECFEEEQVFKSIEMDRISSTEEEGFLGENERKCVETKCTGSKYTGVELPPPLNLFIQESFLNPFPSEKKIGGENENETPKLPDKSVLDLISLKIDELDECSDLGAILENDLNRKSNVGEFNLDKKNRVDNNEKTEEEKEVLINTHSKELSQDVLNDETKFSNFYDLEDNKEEETMPSFCSTIIEETSLEIKKEIEESILIGNLDACCSILDEYDQNVVELSGEVEKLEEITEESKERNQVDGAKRSFDIEGNEIYHYNERGNPSQDKLNQMNDVKCLENSFPPIPVIQEENVSEEINFYQQKLLQSISSQESSSSYDETNPTQPKLNRINNVKYLENPSFPSFKILEEDLPDEINFSNQKSSSNQELSSNSDEIDPTQPKSNQINDIKCLENISFPSVKAFQKANISEDIKFSNQTPLYSLPIRNYQELSSNYHVTNPTQLKSIRINDVKCSDSFPSFKVLEEDLPEEINFDHQKPLYSSSIRNFQELSSNYDENNQILPVINKSDEIIEEKAKSTPNFSSIDNKKENNKEEVNPIKINTESATSPRIFDLPIIGNHNYPNSIISKIALEQSQNKLDELLKLPKSNYRRDKKTILNSNNSSEILNLKKTQENQELKNKNENLEEEQSKNDVALNLLSEMIEKLDSDDDEVSKPSKNNDQKDRMKRETIFNDQNSKILNLKKIHEDQKKVVVGNSNLEEQEDDVALDLLSEMVEQLDSDEKSISINSKNIPNLKELKDHDDSSSSVFLVSSMKICTNLDDTITKLNLEMQRSAEIDESLQLKEEGDARDARRSIDAAASTCVRCAHADQCSCLPAAEEDRAPRHHNNRLHRDHPVSNNSSETKTEETPNNLSWSFKNGRLVFEDVVNDVVAVEETDGPSILTSKNVNPKNNKLKILEEKLKEAGITDGKSEPDCCSLKEEEEEEKDIGNSPVVTSSSSDEEEDFLPSDSEDVTFCEFNSNDLAHQPLILFYNDELDEEEYEEGEEIFIMRGDNAHQNTEQQQQRKLHNPDKENLKSLLKKPGGKHSKEHQQQQSSTKKNRVIFNETKNEFFDADYIILIREECEYDEEEDDGVCTCNQHEMVRLTCCEPNCNCNVYGDGYDTTPPSPKFAPPLEFVDAVTLSPPEEYKDMELEEQQLIALQQQIALSRGQRGAVCRECSASHDDDGEGSLSDNDEIVETPSDDQIRDVEGKEKTDQSQQTTPTTPPADESNDEGQRYILETVTMTTVSERQIMKEADEKPQSPSPAPPTVPPGGSPISGILKGGRLWKQTSNENNTTNSLNKNQDLHQCESITSDDEGTNKRSVRFIESKENQAMTPKQRDVCDGAPDVPLQEEISHRKPDESKESSVISQNQNESTEMMLTFKLGNHVLISNNSLKPNSAVRQLFPCTKPQGKIEESPNNQQQQYLVTAESLKAFEEAKRSKLPQIIQSGDTDESIRRAIERNTLRRSLIRGDPKNKKSTQKTDNSLVERIKQLTCDVDDSEVITNVVEDLQQQQRASPPGEEARNSPEVNANKHVVVDKSFSPSSSSTASSNSSMSSTYKKITDLFSKSRGDKPDIQNVDGKLHLTAPDLGNGTTPQEFIQENALKINTTTESRKQFLSTLVPLTACVSGIGLNEDYYHINNGPEIGGDRTSMASSVGTEYSLEDIDEVLRKDEEENGKKIAPDVIAGTPSASESGDELAMFVQQDAGRIERIKKKYQPETTEEDDEHDDYGFNRRPSVRGIKPRFGSTTEILQQIQNQMQPPNNTPPRNQNQPINSNPQVVWPYYSETNLSSNVETKRNPTPNYPIYPNQVNNEDKRAAYVQYSSRPSSYIDDNLYQNCTNQRCTQINYRNMNVVYPSSVVRIGNEYNATLPRRNSRPLSPPPQEVSKNYHQTMVYIPYNHIEGYHHNYYNTPKECYARVSNQNQINKRYIEAYRVEDHYSKPILRQQQVVYQQRSESPQLYQSTARSTQTPSVVTSSNCYPIYPQRYATRTLPPNGIVYQDSGVYPKINRHSYPRYPPSSDSLSLTDSDSQHSKCSMPNSPTKTNSRFIERGVPEGAASVSPQDSGQMNNSSTMTSPTSPQNPQKPMFYAMNV